MRDFKDKVKVNQTLSDDTRIGCRTWRELKTEGIKPDYYDPNLSSWDAELLNRLIAAQVKQGNLLELEKVNVSAEETKVMKIKELDESIKLAEKKIKEQKASQFQISKLIVGKKEAEDDGNEECEVTVRDMNSDLEVVNTQLAKLESTNVSNAKMKLKLSSKITALKQKLAEEQTQSDGAEEMPEILMTGLIDDRIARTKNASNSLRSRIIRRSKQSRDKIKLLQSQIDEQKAYLKDKEAAIGYPGVTLSS